jgi:D-glycero-alpha-D-manno-heptose-7-phosphate kinase
MIISRTPFRVSFFGGGTDYPDWYRENGGAVISTSINKFCYITCRYLPPFFDYKFRMRYYRREETKTISEIVHPSMRECLNYMQIKDGLEIVHHADVPAQSGLGSSSTFTVGLLHALYAIKHQMPTKRELAILALHIEQNQIRESVGSQDQTAAAFGGFNRINFGGIQEIAVQSILISPEKIKNLEDHLMLFFTGFSRTASEIAIEQIKRISEKKAYLRNMMEFVEEATKLLQNGGNELLAFGKLLHEQWMLKRKLSPIISNAKIDEIYETGLNAGAEGGKLLGAGGGGCILFFVKPKNQQNVKESLNRLLHIPFRFDHLGSQIIYYTHDDHFPCDV